MVHGPAFRIIIWHPNKNEIDIITLIRHMGTRWETPQFWDMGHLEQYQL
jgi:hypothetical protein